MSEIYVRLDCLPASITCQPGLVYSHQASLHPWSVRKTTPDHRSSTSVLRVRVPVPPHPRITHTPSRHQHQRTTHISRTIGARVVALCGLLLRVRTTTITFLHHRVRMERAQQEAMAYQKATTPTWPVPVAGIHTQDFTIQLRPTYTLHCAHRIKI